MEAIVLAGGRGTRLRSLVPDLPKPLAPVKGTPFLSYVLDHLISSGVTDIVLSVGYKANLIYEHYGRSYRDVKISYAHEIKPLGTGGAIKYALTKCKEERVLVANGDTFADLDVSAATDTPLSPDQNLMVLRESVDAVRFDSITVCGEYVKKMEGRGKREATLINAGIYYLHRNSLDSFEDNYAFSFENEFLASSILEGRFKYFLHEGVFIDMGTPSSYLEAAKILEK